jgi:hypothetical protein
LFPTIPAAQVNSDWNATSGVEEILNKPTIPAAQIQSDWTQSNNAALDFIKNKPTLTNGTVTSVATTGLISGGPITASGTITTSMATNKLVGRYSASTGIMEEVTVGSGLTLTPLGVLNNTATPSPTGYYGAFSDITNQTAAAINTGYPMLLGITDLSNQVTVVSGSRVTIANTGIYNIQWSAQFTNPTSSNHDVTIWLRKNGVDVAGSAGIVLVPAKHGSFDGHTLPSWNFLLDVVAGDYYEFVWSTANTSVYISFQAGGNPPPSTASVVLTVTQQAGIMAGTGITAINSLTGAAQTLAVGTSGTDFAISSASSTHTFNLPTASATNRGALSSADWTTFNNKVATTRSISTTSPLSGGGDLSANRTLSIADAAADGSTKGAAAFTAADFNATAGVISIDYTNGQAASAGAKGFLTSADWTTFNAKQAALVSGTNIKTINSASILGSGNIATPFELVVAASDEGTALTTGTAKITFRMPRAVTLTAVRASLTTAQASGSLFTVNIKESGTTILSTKITINNTQKTSTTATTPPVISDTSLADDAEMTIDIDQIGDGTAKGLKIMLIGTYA